MAQSPVEQVKELHVRIRRKGKYHTSVLSHCNPVIQRGCWKMTWQLSILDAEECS
jgi:hypothetical protein